MPVWPDLATAYSDFQNFVSSLTGGVNDMSQIAQGAGVFRIPDLLSGNSGDPRDSTNPYTGTFMIYPPLTLPNGDLANIGGMNAGKIMWYGNSATGRLVAAGGNISIDYNGLVSSGYGVFLGGIDAGLSVAPGSMLFTSINDDGTRILNGNFSAGLFTSWTTVDGGNGAPSIIADSPFGTYSAKFPRNSYIEQTFTVGLSGSPTVVTFLTKYPVDAAVGIGYVKIYDGSSVLAENKSFSTSISNSFTRVTLIFAAIAGTTRTLRFGLGAGSDNTEITNIEVYDLTGYMHITEGLIAGYPDFQFSIVPSIAEQSSAYTPVSGYGSFYPKTDNLPYFKNDAGTEMLLFQSAAGIGATPNDGWIADTNTWSYSSGIRTQAYTNDPAAGSSIALNVASTSGFLVGDTVTVSSSAGSETARIISLVANTSITVNTLALNHTTTSPLITLSESTYVISINADMTSLIGAGDKIKLTQSTAKYFIVTAVGAYSAGATLVTVFGGTDYTLANTSITSPLYSHIKNAFGFPASPAKWTISLTDTSTRSQASPVASTWYNLGNNAFTIPIGLWKAGYTVLGTADRASGNLDVNTSFSTSASAVSDGTSSRKVASRATQTYLETSLASEQVLSLAAKTPYYIITMTAQSSVTNIYNNNAAQTLVLYAVSAYL